MAQASHGVLLLRSWSCSPIVPHGVQPVWPCPIACVPTPHAAHCVAEVFAEKRPDMQAAQAVLALRSWSWRPAEHGVHADAPDTVACVPTPHAAHCIAEVLGEKRPDAQAAQAVLALRSWSFRPAEHGVHADAPDTVACVPTPHAAHCVAEVFGEKRPDVQAAQAVLALRSWSWRPGIQEWHSPAVVTLHDTVNRPEDQTCGDVL